MFGPVLMIWFVVIAILGARQIEHHPDVLAAFNPILGLEYLRHAGLFDALLILSALMLVVTGGEAMYADVGHFGAQPIRASWFAVVYPALLLNYLGQGAYLLSGAPVAGGKLFYSLVPPPLLYPMVLLATAATVIASQALISGAFRLARKRSGWVSFRALISCTPIKRMPVRFTCPSSTGRFVPVASYSSSRSAPARRWRRRMGWPRQA